MGYYGKLEFKLQAQSLRKQGKSYSEIMNALSLSKSTVSDWCKDVPLSSKIRARLYANKTTGALRGSAIAAQRKIAARLQITKSLYLDGAHEVGKLDKRDRFIAGIAYYSAEGTKTDKGCAFSNSDPAIITFMVKWFREFGNVPLTKFHAAIWIHHNQSVQRALTYWSTLTGIPKANFYKSYVVRNKDKSKKIRKQLHQHGVVSLYVSNVKLQRKIMGWIGGILQKPMI